MIWGQSDVFKFEAGGVQLEGQYIGPSPENGKTIVLLHEGLGSIALWRDFPALLSRETGYGVFVYSRQGYGGSDPAVLPRPLDYMTREASPILGEVLNHIGFKRGFLLGHSDGASIAALYAGMHADNRLEGIILMAPHFFPEPISIEAIQSARTAYDDGDLRERLLPYHKQVDNAFRGWNDAWLDPNFLHWNIEKTLATIPVPVLAIQGDADEYGTLKQMDSLKRHVQNSLRVEILAGCKHSPHMQKPDEVMAIVKSFLHENASLTS